MFFKVEECGFDVFYDVEGEGIGIVEVDEIGEGVVFEPEKCRGWFCRGQ